MSEFVSAAVAEAACECWETPPSRWTTYGSYVEPGSQWEYNPGCPAHGDPEPEAECLARSEARKEQDDE